MAHKVVNGVVVELTDEEIQQINDSVEAVAATQTKDWEFNRRAEYPTIADQLDDIFHNGIDGWKATIQVTKDKYPKE